MLCILHFESMYVIATYYVSNSHSFGFTNIYLKSVVTQATLASHTSYCRIITVDFTR